MTKYKISINKRSTVEVKLNFNSVLRRLNYLFSALTPAPPLSLISAPAPVLYCRLKLLYNSSIIPMEV